jgi:hypothetical protein
VRLQQELLVDLPPRQRLQSRRSGQKLIVGWSQNELAVPNAFCLARRDDGGADGVTDLSTGLMTMSLMGAGLQLLPELPKRSRLALVLELRLSP